MKRMKKFWKMQYDSIQEPYPHHTLLCLKCGTLYNRRLKVAKKCQYCQTKFKKNKFSEFYVGKNKIYFGKNLEEKRKILR